MSPQVILRRRRRRTVAPIAGDDCSVGSDFAVQEIPDKRHHLIQLIFEREMALYLADEAPAFGQIPEVGPGAI